MASQADDFPGWIFPDALLERGGLYRCRVWWRLMASLAGFSPDALPERGGLYPSSEGVPGWSSEGVPGWIFARRATRSGVVFFYRAQERSD